MRVLGNQPAHQGHGCIIGAGHAEDDLVTRVAEPETRSECLLAEIIEAADRAHQRHGRCIIGGFGRRRTRPQAHRDNAGAEEMNRSVQNNEQDSPVGEAHGSTFFEGAHLQRRAAGGYSISGGGRLLSCIKASGQ
jgi:hypothetical protein